MAVLGEIRKRPWLLMGVIALGLVAFLFNADTIDKIFGKDPNILGKVNGDNITRDEFNDQLFVLQQQAQQQGQPQQGLEEQAWQMMVQAKLIKQEFDKTGLVLTDDMFWSQLQFDPMFAQNPQNFDEKGNFKVQEIKKQLDELQKSGNAEMLNNWNRTKKSIEYRIMARQLFGNVTNGITTNKKEVDLLMKQRDEIANIDYVKVDYSAFEKTNAIKVTTQDLADYIKLHPTRFKAETSRNLGLVYFPAAPSAQDDAAALNEINKLFTKGTDASNGTENFQNTKNDSMFVELNSDVPFMPQFVSANQLPSSIKDKITNATIGETFGPYKEQNLYIVSKLLAKKPSDSTETKHILISYKDTQIGQQDPTVKRTKEQAKKLADSIYASVKANPAAFDTNLKFSDDKGSAAQGGNVGWTTADQPKFVPEFQKFVDNSPKGAIGVVETQFGYHIINIMDKKSGSMGYKIAHLAKTIKASDKTENEVHGKATRFIQQVQGKSFNEFNNIAKKSGFAVENPKAVTRFQGKLQGVNTDKDAEVISWAFNKKREIGDTDIFTVDGTGARIVAYVVGKQDAGLANPETVRDQIEPIVKNKLLAKKITEKITAANATSLDQVAKLFGTTKASASINIFSPSIDNAMEPRVGGAAFGVANNKVSNPIEGNTGVYVLIRKNITTNKLPGDAKQIMESITQQNSQMYGQMFLKSLQDKANIKDFRIEVWDKTPQH